MENIFVKCNFTSTDFCFNVSTFFLLGYEEGLLSEAEENRVKSLLVQLERHFQKLKRRIRRHGVSYFKKIVKSKQELLQTSKCLVCF